MKKTIKKTVFKVFIILSSAIILLALIFFTNGFGDMVHMLANARYRWIAVSFGCMVMYWTVGALILQLITRSLFERQRFTDSLKVTMIGHYFNSITPFAMGGQPVQAYVMTKDGVKPGHSVSILVIRAALFQVVTLLYCLIAVIFKGQFFKEYIPQFYLFYFIGVAINLFTIFLYALFFFNKDVAHKVLMFIFNFFKKIKFLKNLDRWREKTEAELVSFSDGAHILQNNPRIIIGTMLLQFVQFTFFFAIPYFIYMAVEKGDVNIFNVIAAQSVVTMLTLFVPSPGSTGGAEGISYVFFRMFFSRGYIIPVILVWRIITFYSNIIFGGLYSLFAPEKPLKKDE